MAKVLATEMAFFFFLLKKKSQENLTALSFTTFDKYNSWKYIFLSESFIHFLDCKYLTSTKHLVIVPNYAYFCRLNAKQKPGNSEMLMEYTWSNCCLLMPWPWKAIHKKMAS